MRAALALIALCGCGRIGFDVVVDDAAVDTSLVAWWRMDALAGGQTADATGRGHTATCGGGACPALVAGHLGNALAFDGVGQQLAVTWTSDFDTTTGLTVTSFYNETGTPNVAGCAISKPFGMDICNSWQVCIDPQTHTAFFYSCDATTVADQLFSSGLPPANGWHHLAIRWDGSTKAIFVDGAMDTSDARSIAFDTSEIVIGADIDGGSLGSFFAGQLDDVRVYRRALSDGEIAQLAAQ